VYNLTPYLHYHPGGTDILVKTAGRDATAFFQKYHPWVNLEGLVGVSRGEHVLPSYTTLSFVAERRQSVGCSVELAMKKAFE